MAETTVYMAPKKTIQVQIKALLKQISELEKFLKAEITNKKQLEAIKAYITDDGLYMTYSDIIAPQFEEIRVNDIAYIIRQQLKLCRQDLADLVTLMEQYK